MGTGWRRAFHRRGGDAEKDSSPVSTPRLLCKTAVAANHHHQNGTADLVSPRKSPRSPFSYILKTTLGRISRNSCGVCSQIVKKGQRMAIYTAECSHTFHFPCIASHARNQGSLICPLCSTIWKNVPLLAAYTQQSTPKFTCYADDEQLVTPPFSQGEDKEEEEEEFRGFFVNPVSSSDVDLRLLPDAAVISQGRTHHTYAVVLNVKAPPPPQAARRAPIDLVAVLDVGSSMCGPKLEMLKRAMRLVVASLGPADRLSILAFSAAPNRLLPLQKMTPQGQRSARIIVDRLCCSHGSSMPQALKEATRILEQRRQRNPVASIILLSDVGHDVPESNGSAHSTRYAHVEIPVHSDENAFSKCVAGLLSVVVHDLRIQIGFAPGSDPAEVTAIYSCTESPTLLRLDCVLVGDLYAEEEKELLVEIQVPVSRVGSHYVIWAKCSHKDPVTQELVYGKEQLLLVPKPQTVRSGLPRIDRLRSVFISSRAVAESRRLIEQKELSSAMQLLSSARALLLQSSAVAGDCIRSLEAAVSEVQWRRQYQLREERELGLFVDEPLMPSTAAQKLAHVKKSFCRVDSDLHGFENARF